MKIISSTVFKTNYYPATNTLGARVSVSWETAEFLSIQKKHKIVTHRDYSVGIGPQTLALAKSAINAMGDDVIFKDSECGNYITATRFYAPNQEMGSI